MMKGKVSVVLPVRYVNFNWLKRSISSVLGQDYQNLELIIVNDEATENIDNLIKSFKIRKYIKNNRNRKLPYSLNRGFEVANGEYHTWTSADNFMLPGMISRLVRELEQRRDFSVVCGRSKVIDEHGNFIVLPSGELKAAKLSGYELSNTYIETKYTYYSTLGACFLYKKEVWEQMGGYDESLHGAEDYDFWIRTSRKFKICRIPWEEEPLYVYRVHSSSISSNVNGCFTIARLTVLKREARTYPENHDLKRAIEHYSDLVINAQKEHNIFRRLLHILKR